MLKLFPIIYLAVFVLNGVPFTSEPIILCMYLPDCDFMGMFPQLREHLFVSWYCLT